MKKRNFYNGGNVLMGPVIWTGCSEHYQGRAKEAVAMYRSCTLWRGMLRSSMDSLLDFHLWRDETALQVTSCLAGEINIWKLHEAKCVRLAEWLMPLYCTCGVWRRLLKPTLQTLSSSFSWHQAYSNCLIPDRQDLEYQTDSD